MKSFKICLDVIHKKITTSAAMHGTLKTTMTYSLGEHVAQTITLSI